MLGNHSEQQAFFGHAVDTARRLLAATGLGIAAVFLWKLREQVREFAPEAFIAMGLYLQAAILVSIAFLVVFGLLSLFAAMFSFKQMLRVVFGDEGSWLAFFTVHALQILVALALSTVFLALSLPFDL